SVTDAASLRDHAAACARCNAALDDALITKDALLPRLHMPRPRYVPAIAAATALAAALALIVAWPRGGDDEVQTKGGSIVGFFVSHDGNVRRGAQQEAVMPGDRLELFTTTTERVWF